MIVKFNRDRETYLKLSKEIPKALVLAHTDNDGYSGGAVCVKMLNDLFGYKLSNIDVINTDYIDPLKDIDKYDFVVIVDISISNKKDADKLVAFAGTPDKYLIWLDHHQTSLDLSKDNPNMQAICGIRDNDGSGVMLAYIYYMLLKGKFDKFADSSIAEIVKNAPIPNSIRLIDDHDRWVLKMEDSKYLVEAFNLYPGYPKDCKSLELIRFVIDDSIIYTNKYLIAGKTALEAKTFTNLDRLRALGFIASLKGFPNTKMVCLNTVNKSSVSFGPLMKKYGRACAYTFGENGLYTVSVYRDEYTTSSPSAADICTSFGGGGHANAAGFTTKDLEFINPEELTEKDIELINKESVSAYSTLFSVEKE